MWALLSCFLVFNILVFFLSRLRPKSLMARLKYWFSGCGDGVINVKFCDYVSFSITIQSRFNNVCSAHWSWCEHVNHGCVTWPGLYFDGKLTLLTLCQVIVISSVFPLLYNLDSILGADIDHGGNIAVRQMSADVDLIFN